VYIVILVDKLDRTQRERVDHGGVMIHYVSKGQHMVGLRYRHMRPTLIIDAIEDRNLGLNVEFDDWWRHCVIPNASSCKIVKAGDL
jgi:hypothetical protein